MTLEQIYTMLNGIAGFSGHVTYRAWEKPHPLPFICYLVAYSNNFAADGIVYHKINHIQIELYTATKDTATEELVEAALEENGLYWEKTEEYLDSESCYEILYEIEV